MVIQWDLMGFNGDLMRFNGIQWDLMGFNGIYDDIPSGKLTKSYEKWPIEIDGLPIKNGDCL